MNILTLGAIIILVVCHAVTGFAAHPYDAYPARNADASHYSINSVLGDASFVAAFGRLPSHAVDEDLRIVIHLEYVERLLRGRDVHVLPWPLQQERLRNIEHLRAYRMHRIFPRNHDYPGERRPCFIDRDGRICAVGYLVEQSAGRDVAKRINSTFQYARIREMQSPDLQSWLAGSGLTLEEAAMIQPEYWEDYSEYQYYHFAETNIRARYPEPLPSLRRFKSIITQMKSSTADWVIDSLNVVDHGGIPSVYMNTVRSDGSWQRAKSQTDYYGNDDITSTFEMKDDKGWTFTDQTLYTNGLDLSAGLASAEMQSRISRWRTGSRLDSIYEYHPYRPDSVPQASGFFVRKTYFGKPDTVVKYIWPVIPKNLPKIPPNTEVPAGLEAFTTVREHDGSLLVRTTRLFDRRRGVNKRITTVINDSVAIDEQFDTLGLRKTLVKYDASCSCYLATRYEYDTLHNPTFEITYRYRNYASVLYRRNEVPVKMVRREYEFNEYGDWIRQFETVNEIKGDSEVATITRREYRRLLRYAKGLLSGGLFQKPLKDVVVEP